MSSDDTGRLHRLRSAASATTTLASAWTQAKTAQLQYRAHQLQTRLDSPDSWIEAGGDDGTTDRFTTREAKRKQLRQYHDIRLDGGIVATLLEARALMVFGVGGEFTHETDVVAEWCNNQFDHLDLLTLDIGEDSLFYGYSIGEIRETVTGEFGKVEFIEPWTTTPIVSNKGDILEWEQKVDHHHGSPQEQSFDPDDILHFNVMKESGRDPVGMSMLGRAMDEAMAYRDNQQAIQNAVRLHAFPKWHIKLGREGGAVIDDNELRRARPKFDNIDELTKWVTGQDVDINTISPEGFEFENITEHDLSKLAIAFMLPVELTQLGGGDGLGTGFPARLRERLFLLSAQAQQNQLAGQLVDQLARRLIREYSPFDEDVVDELAFRFNDPITDMEELEKKVNAVGDDMTVNERRALFDMPPLEDESVGEDFDSPGSSGGGEEAGFFAELQQPQRGDGGVAAESLEWISRYAQTDGSVDELIGDWLAWLETTSEVEQADPERARVGVELFAANQGIGFDEAVDQPLNNLVRYYHRNRALAAVPDNAVNIDNPGEAPEGASVIEGPRGGTYYVPGGDGGGGGGGGAGGDLSGSPEFSDDPPDEVDISDATGSTNLTEAGVPDGSTKEDIDIVDTDDGQVFVKEQGLMDFVREQGFEGTVNDPLASTQMGSAVVRGVGGGTTTNWVDSENDTIRSEGVDNVVGAASNGETDFDEDSLTDTIAAGLLSGNEDMHAAQFVADGDGQAYLIDHDHAGRSLEDDRVIRKLQAVSGPLATQDIEFETVWNRAKEQVENADIDGMAANLEAQGLDEHAENLRANAAFIEANDASEVA